VHWKEDWSAISRRIDGLREGALFFAQAAPHAMSLPANAIGALVETARKTHKEIVRFRGDHAASLSPEKIAAIQELLNRAWPAFSNDSLNGWPGMVTFISLLTTIQVEMNQLLADPEATKRSLARRAFLHLQRSIVADPDTRAKWQSASKVGERECEQLGAIHLLYFGLYAFKVTAAGERTDLVFGRPINLPEVESSIEALVLTEWKLVRQQSEAQGKLAEGLAQLKAYSSGALAAMELSSLRFLILVSEAPFGEIMTEKVDGAVCYVIVNLAVNPVVPSIQARRQTMPRRQIA
jgi:hypothetical protein